MPHKKKSRQYLAPLVLFTLAGWALWALGRNEPTASEASEAEPSESPRASGSTHARPRATWSKRRLATSLAFATLFFGGAAFSAGAGEVVADALEGEATTEVTSTETAPDDESVPAEDGEGGEKGESGEEPAEGEDPPAEGESPADGEDPPAEGETPAEGEEPAEGEAPADGTEPPALPGTPGEGEEPGEGAPPAPLPADPSGGSAPDAPAPSDPGGDRPGKPAPSGDLPVVDKQTRSPAHLDPEANAEGFFSTVWLHRPLPDPTPPAKRLKQGFASALAREAARAKVDWALVLGVLRARGFDSSSMSIRPVRATARQLAELKARRYPLRALKRYGGEKFADEALALRNYNRAVGLRSLVEGFEAAKPRLQREVLRDKRLSIYAGGRLDIAMGRTDVRILVLLRYLAETHGQATISSLTTGHRLYARPGVVSAHIYGLAVDVAALDDRSIYGNQEPGGLTHQAVKNILALPAELQPKQVISLLGLGGPSFPLANHDDHIHVGY
jgi:hypothetical protein